MRGVLQRMQQQLKEMRWRLRRWSDGTELDHQNDTANKHFWIQFCRSIQDEKETVKAKQRNLRGKKNQNQLEEKQSREWLPSKSADATTSERAKASFHRNATTRKVGGTSQTNSCALEFAKVCCSAHKKSLP